MRDSAESVSNRKFSERKLSGTYQTVARAPTTMVETCGVRKRGCVAPRAAGIAPARAIESTVREAGRMVVWVEARAEVRTASTTSLSQGEPRTPVARVLR